jgi:hypothetical protein
MPRIFAAFLTGALSAVLLIISAVRRDVSLQPFDIAVRPALSAAPAISRRSGDIVVTSPSGAPTTAPSSPAPYVASDPNPTMTPSPPPREIPMNPTPVIAPTPESSDIDSSSTPTITPSPLASDLPARPIAAPSRPAYEISPGPAPLIRPPLVSETSTGLNLETAPPRPATAGSGGRKQLVRLSHPAVRPTPVSPRPPRNPSAPPMCARGLMP